MVPFHGHYQSFVIRSSFLGTLLSDQVPLFTRLVHLFEIEVSGRFSLTAVLEKSLFSPLRFPSNLPPSPLNLCFPLMQTPVSPETSRNLPTFLLPAIKFQVCGFSHTQAISRTNAMGRSKAGWSFRRFVIEHVQARVLGQVRKKEEFRGLQKSI